MHIWLSPTLRDLSLTVSARAASKLFPFNAGQVSMWHRGRTAIWQGIHRLGLGPGDRVLVPAYACGAEIDALLRAGLDLSYYRIGPTLSPDMAHLEELCKEPARALFVIHYFGYPQPIRTLAQFAQVHRLLLIEDNTHGLYSTDEEETPLGSLGDMSVFSFHKTLPLPDGAGLVLNSASKIDSGPQSDRRPSIQSQTIKLIRMLKKDMMARFPETGAWVKARMAKLLTRRNGGETVHNSGVDADAFPSTPEDMQMKIKQASWRMSSVARLLTHHVDHGSIVETRRRNFQLLDEELRDRNGNRPLLRKLPQGCCPWVYPLWEEDSEGLVHFLAAQGVGSVRFWLSDHPAVPLVEFPFEQELKRHVVVLPVHQGLSQATMIELAALVNTWRARGGRPSG